MPQEAESSPQEAEGIADSLDVGLKEWDSVCSALIDGSQILLLRKGGIGEQRAGFQLKHGQFLLFPTFLHQKLELLKSQHQYRCRASGEEPEHVTLSAACEVVETIQLRDPAQMDPLSPLHIWTQAQIDMRFHYKPENPLYLVFVRTYLLPTPMTIENTPRYAGCKSWVPLEHSVETVEARPALSDADFAARLQAVRQRLTF